MKSKEGDIRRAMAQIQRDGREIGSIFSHPFRRGSSLLHQKHIFLVINLLVAASCCGEYNYGVACGSIPLKSGNWCNYEKMRVWKTKRKKNTKAEDDTSISGKVYTSD